MKKDEVYDKLKKLAQEWIDADFWVGVCGADDDFNIDYWIGWGGDAEKVFLELFPTKKDFDELVKYCSEKMSWTSCDPNEIGYIIDNWGDECDEDGNENDTYYLSETYKNPHVCISHAGGSCYITGYTKGCDKELVDTITELMSEWRGDMTCGPLGLF